MQETLLAIFGEGENLNAWQMGARAAVIFLYTLVLIRIAGKRSFGLRTPLDNIIVILLGAIMSRAVVGASPFIPTLFAGFVVAILHSIFAMIGYFSHAFGYLTKGTHVALFKNGEFIKSKMFLNQVTHEDIREELRIRTQRDSLEHVDAIYIERNGEISVVFDKSKEIS